MSYTEKTSHLNHKNSPIKGERVSEPFRPNERLASAEALICLKCPLPANACKPSICKRYKEEKLKVNGGK